MTTALASSLQQSKPASAAPEKSTPKRAYPGTYDNMFMEAKSVVMVDILDGFRASVMKQVTPFFAITHEYDYAFALLTGVDSCWVRSSSPERSAIRSTTFRSMCSTARWALHCGREG